MLTLKWIKELLLTGVEECLSFAGAGVLVLFFFACQGEFWRTTAETPRAKLTAPYVRAVFLGVIIKQEV